MRHRLATFVAVLSTLLMIVIVAAWVRSLFTVDLLTCRIYQYGRHTTHVTSLFYRSIEGGNRVAFIAPHPVNPPANHASTDMRWNTVVALHQTVLGTRRVGGFFERLGFVFQVDDQRGSGPRRSPPPHSPSGSVAAPLTTTSTSTATATGLPSVRLAVPYWFLLCLTLPLLWISGRAAWRDRVRRTRRRRGHCETCGYDLRGSDGDACPECGRSLDQSPSTTTNSAARDLHPASAFSSQS